MVVLHGGVNQRLAIASVLASCVLELVVEFHFFLWNFDLSHWGLALSKLLNTARMNILLGGMACW